MFLKDVCKMEQSSTEFQGKVSESTELWGIFYFESLGVFRGEKFDYLS